MCQTCDKLRAEIRELREELAEWRNQDSIHESGDAAIIATRLKTWPQVAKLIAILAENENRVVSREYFVEALEYAGAGRDHDRRGTDEDRWLKVIVSRARRALESVGVFDAVGNVWGQGYIMTKEKARDVRRVVGIDE